VLAVALWRPISTGITWLAVRVARRSVSFAGRHKRLGVPAVGWAGYLFYLALLGPLTGTDWVAGAVAAGQLLVLFYSLTLVAEGMANVEAYDEHRKAQSFEAQFRAAHIDGVKPPPARVGRFDELTGVYIPTRTDLVAAFAPWLATALTSLALR
jgi:hypothetical protein